MLGIWDFGCSRLEDISKFNSCCGKIWVGQTNWQLRCLKPGDHQIPAISYTTLSLVILSCRGLSHKCITDSFLHKSITALSVILLQSVSQLYLMWYSRTGGCCKSHIHFCTSVSVVILLYKGLSQITDSLLYKCITAQHYLLWYTCMGVAIVMVHHHVILLIIPFPKILLF